VYVNYTCVYVAVRCLFGFIAGCVVNPASTLSLLLAPAHRPTPFPVPIPAGWTLKSFIVKAGDDLRKEVLAMQLIDYCKHVFSVEGLDIAVKPYQIVSTGQQSGETAETEIAYLITMSIFIFIRLFLNC
jgi:hypothetical protein